MPLARRAKALDKPAGLCYNRGMDKKIVWYKVNDRLFGTLEDAKNEIMKYHPELLDDDMPDYFDSHIEEVVSDKFNGYVNAHNWADWHGEP